MAIDYGRYLRLSAWTSDEAACLLNGIAPDDWQRISNGLLIDAVMIHPAFERASDHGQEVLRRMVHGDIRRLLAPIKECLERDLLAGCIAPISNTNGTDYYDPRAFVSWAAGKGFAIPDELAALISNAPSRKQAVLIDDAPSREQAAVTELARPSKVDAWFEAIDAMRRDYLSIHSTMPSVHQAWAALCNTPPHGYDITPEVKNRDERLNMPGARPLTKANFTRRWKQYTDKRLTANNSE